MTAHHDKKPLLVVAGPTGVGKTKLSLTLADALNAEIISADSMQVYRQMDIGTAKIRTEEMKGIPHHLIDVLAPDEECNVVTYCELVKPIIADIHHRGKVPLLAGGTGFYIQAVARNLSFAPSATGEQMRLKAEQEAAQFGYSYMYDQLSRIDPEAAAAIHPNNHKRVLRALSFYYETHTLFSLHNKDQKAQESPYNLLYTVLTDERERLYRRIDERVEQMLADGLVEEVKALLQKGYAHSLSSMQGLGYKEIIGFLDGAYDLEEAIRILKRDTRHFAKRQITWFKREEEAVWFSKADYQPPLTEQNLAEDIIALCRKRKLI
ncbi:MAG: tRNA (adenosine(37)-N6)-dimethylallyltransferase MiaA [Lachnospiraceae bacterium]